MSEKSTLAEIKERGVIRIAVAYTPPPEEGYHPEFYLHPENGQPAGVVPELGRVMAADLAVAAEFVDVPWPDHLAALLAGHVDLLMSYTNTPARALEAEFAGPLLPSQVVVMLSQHSPVRQREELNRPDKRLAVSPGSSIARLAAQVFPAAQLVETADPAGELAAGHVDGCIVDAITKIFLQKHPHLKLLRDETGKLVVLAQEWGHPAVRVGQQRWLNWLNNWLDYHREGVIRYWCDTWWHSWMAE